jgi:hypothetical protein
LHSEKNTGPTGCQSHIMSLQTTSGSVSWPLVRGLRHPQHYRRPPPPPLPPTEFGSTPFSCFNPYTLVLRADLFIVICCYQVLAPLPHACASAGPGGIERRGVGGNHSHLLTCDSTQTNVFAKMRCCASLLLHMCIPVLVHTWNPTSLDHIALPRNPFSHIPLLPPPPQHTHTYSRLTADGSRSWRPPVPVQQPEVQSSPPNPP